MIAFARRHRLRTIQGNTQTMFRLFGRHRRPRVQRSMRQPPRLAAAAPPLPARAAADPIQAPWEALREAFTPTQPQRNPRRLAGRASELSLIVGAISYNRAHVVLYGDRGRGKTSLVNLVATSARTAGYMVGRYACAQDSTFDDIMRGVARDLPRPFLSVPACDELDLEGCEAALPQRSIAPRDIALLPGRLSGRRLVLIIDEFDRVIDGEARTRLADTIKQVSDRGARVSIVVVGVSDSLEDLLGQHRSIQRNVVGVHLPLLTDADIHGILALGADYAHIEYPRHIQDTIAGLARGVPYIAHLLGLHAGEAALQRGSRAVASQDLRSAISQSIAELDPRVAVGYEELTQAGQDLAMRQLLHIIAETGHDRYARFSVRQEGDAFRIGDRQIDGALWTRLREAGVVRPCRSAGFGLHTLSEPMLLHYILLRRMVEAGPLVARPNREAAA